MKAQEILDSWRPELVSYLEEMVEFSSRDSRDVLLTLSGFSARASYMRNFASRSKNDLIVRFRIDEIDPFLSEVDRQFKIYSRLITVAQAEFSHTS